MKKLNQESQKWMQQMVKNIELNERTYFFSKPYLKGYFKFFESAEIVQCY